MAFSGATPTNCGSNPRYNPMAPSVLITVLKQSQPFLYKISFEAVAVLVMVALVENFLMAELAVVWVGGGKIEGMIKGV